jgi:hypothetical protein
MRVMRRLSREASTRYTIHFGHRADPESDDPLLPSRLEPRRSGAGARRRADRFDGGRRDAHAASPLLWSFTAHLMLRR